MSTSRVVITGVGTVNAAFVGGGAALAAWLARPESAVRETSADGPGDRLPRRIGAVRPEALRPLIEEAEGRRLSRVCQLTVAAARLAIRDAGLGASEDLGLVVGTEFGDLRSTIEFADGYLDRGPAGVSALLFPNTVMNTMAATTAIAVAARARSLTLNVPVVGGELAVARAAAAVSSGRMSVALAGGVDEIDPFVTRALAGLGAPTDARGEGATFVVLETEAAARARGASVLGEVAGYAWRALPAAPCAVGREAGSRAVTAALEMAGVRAAEIDQVYSSASGDAPREAWERSVLERALAPARPETVALGLLLGQHAGLGALRVAAAAQQAYARRRPMLVHGLARGGTHVAVVVRAAARSTGEASL